MLALPYGAADTGALAVRGIAGQERLEVLRRRDRSHAGPAAAVRDAERLVQVQVADVGADPRGRGEPDLRVHVRAVHVDLAAVRVDDLADLAHVRLEHAVRRRVGDHQRAEAARACSAQRARRSARSTLPASSQRTATTRKPAITALAGLVPWAETGIRHTSRCASPRAA